MTPPAQLARMLDHEVINLGFCARGHCHPFMADGLARIDTALFIIDPLANNTPQKTYQSFTRFSATHSQRTTNNAYTPCRQ